MLPSWFTKLRDVKTGYKHSKQQDKPHGSPTTFKKWHDAPASLAKSFSLRRASSKARSTHFESEILDACRTEDNVRASITSTHSDLCKNGQSVCDSPHFEEVTGALLTQNCPINLNGTQPKCTSQVETDVKKLYSWDDGVQSIANSKGSDTLKLMTGEESQSSTQKGHVISDTDTEEFVHTSETSSTFGSETSSADSSVSSKCSTCEDGHQGSQLWLQGVRNSECMHLNLQKNSVGSFDAKVAKEERESSGCPKLTSLSLQETAGTRQSPILYERQRRKECTLFLSSSINGERDGSTSPSDANKGSPNSSKTRNMCISLENSSSLIERDANYSRLRLKGDDSCDLLDDHSSGQQMADWKMPLVLNGRRKLKVKADSVLELSGDEQRACTFDNSSLPVAEGSLQRDGETAHTSEGSQDIATGSTPCTHQMSMGDFTGKYTTSQMQRRRQRGSSISAVLPPDLQGVVGDSLAFVKISDDPYEDFRQSMYEMIMEKDVEGSMDVEELLYCYLTLNSPEHHDLIEEVFSDVWSAVLMTMR